MVYRQLSALRAVVMITETVQLMELFSQFQLRTLTHFSLDQYRSTPQASL
jgi:hypothetical protein